MAAYGTALSRGEGDRRLRALYKVGIEFTGWPTRPGVTPIKGPAKPDPRYLPIDMKEGKCKGRCVAVAKGKFESTKKAHDDK